MSAQFSVNPVLTTVAAGSFGIDTSGYIQGTALDAPNTRNNLAGGVLASTETLPMWGGVAVQELITTVPLVAGGTLGNSVARASALTNLTGFAVFDQDYSMVNSPQSPVPLAATGMGVNFYRLGSGARIAVACDPSLASLEGGLINQNVSWDFNDQMLQPYVASGATISITSITWANTNGGRGTVVAGAAVPFGLGDTVYISGATNTGTGGAAAVNGPFVIDTYTDTTHFTLAMPAAAGVIGTIGGTIVANVGTGALAVKVLDIQVGNSMTVSYNAATGFATWNRSGTTAIILI
jgi:hypothetical protein